MASINDITINLSLNTKPLSAQGFGLPLILGSRAEAENAEYANVYAEYFSLKDMTEAGFEPADKEYKMAAAMFAQSPCPESIAVFVRSADVSIADALAKLAAVHNDWYALLITERDKGSLSAAGDFALANEKLFFGCSNNLEALTGRNCSREAYLLHDAPESYPEAAWVGLCLPQDIGSITWKWKSPAGVAAAGFSSSELSTIRQNNGQTLSERSGFVYTNEGITTSGEFIDNIMSRDYIKARLGEALFGLSVKKGKIAFDDTGFALIHAAMKEVFDTAGARGIIAAVSSEEDAELSDEGVYMYSISIPKRADIAANDRAARKVSGITFSFMLAGAVHGMIINGTIEV